MAQPKNQAAAAGARYAERMNSFWIEPQKRDVMGYKLQGIADGVVVPQGTPLKVDDKAKTAEVCRYAYVRAVSNDKKTLTVDPGHFMDASTKVAISGADTLVQINIASVKAGKSVGEGDTIVLSAANSTIKAGDVLVEVASDGSAVAAKALPNRVASASSDIHGTVPAAHEALLIRNVVNYPAEYLNETTYPGTTTLVGNPAIRFMYQ